MKEKNLPNSVLEGISNKSGNRSKTLTTAFLCALLAGGCKPEEVAPKDPSGVEEQIPPEENPDRDESEPYDPNHPNLKPGSIEWILGFECGTRLMWPQIVKDSILNLEETNPERVRVRDSLLKILEWPLPDESTINQMPPGIHPQTIVCEEDIIEGEPNRLSLSNLDAELPGLISQARASRTSRGLKPFTDSIELSNDPSEEERVADILSGVMLACYKILAKRSGGSAPWAPDISNSSEWDLATREVNSADRSCGNVCTQYANLFVEIINKSKNPDIAWLRSKFAPKPGRIAFESEVGFSDRWTNGWTDFELKKYPSDAQVSIILSSLVKPWEVYEVWAAIMFNYAIGTRDAMYAELHEEIWPRIKGRWDHFTTAQTAPSDIDLQVRAHPTVPWTTTRYIISPDQDPRGVVQLSSNHPEYRYIHDGSDESKTENYREAKVYRLANWEIVVEAVRDGLNFLNEGPWEYDERVQETYQKANSSRWELLIPTWWYYASSTAGKKSFFMDDEDPRTKRNIGGLYFAWRWPNESEVDSLPPVIFEKYKISKRDGRFPHAHDHLVGN